MPVCQRCKEVFPPNYVDIIPNSGQMFDGEYPKECIFCKLQVSEVERETSDGSGQYVAYTKRQCIADYKTFLNNLKRSRNVQDILNKTNNSRSIKL